jgi:predicted phosphodiesterase
MKKIAVLVDIHANQVAFKAVLADIEAWDPDEVVLAGDVVNRGPRPAECLLLAEKLERERGWRLVRGNHEDYVLFVSKPGAPLSGIELEVHRGSYWTFCRLGGDISTLEAMPFQQSLAGPDGREVRIVHASMRGNRDGIFPETRDLTLRKQIDPPPAVFVSGHTHRPLVRRLGETLVVNTGSAGLPFDLDHRPAYARLSWSEMGWEAEIVRVPYDLEAAVADFFTTGFIPEAGPLADLVLVELREARSQLFQWACLFQERCLAGELSMEASVKAFLEEFAGE